MSLQALDPGGDLAAQGIELRLWRVDLDAAPIDEAPSAVEQLRAARFKRADEGRSGQKERLREVKIEGGHLAPTRQKSFSSPKWEALHPKFNGR